MSFLEYKILLEPNKNNGWPWLLLGMSHRELWLLTTNSTTFLLPFRTYHSSQKIMSRIHALRHELPSWLAMFLMVSIGFLAACVCFITFSKTLECLPLLFCYAPFKSPWGLKLSLILPGSNLRFMWNEYTVYLGEKFQLVYASGPINCWDPSAGIRRPFKMGRCLCHSLHVIGWASQSPLTS